MLGALCIALQLAAVTTETLPGGEGGVHSPAEPIALASDAAFTSAISSADILLVSFGVPWCSHCRTFAPVLQEATRMLAAVNLTSVVAEIDCEAAPHTCAEHLPGKQRWPTVVLFRGGQRFMQYSGPRNAQDIASFITVQFEASALVSVIPLPVLNLLNAARRPALINAVAGMALALCTKHTLQLFSTALVAFCCVWCTWLVAGFLFGTAVPTALAVAVIVLVTVGLGQNSDQTGSAESMSAPVQQQQQLQQQQAAAPASSLEQSSAEKCT
jgi:hypothetical protein